MTTRGSTAGLIIAGVVIAAVGLGVALVKALGFPGYSVWFVVGGGLLLVGAVRRLTRPPR